jgi:hypothetical protein
VTVYFDSSALVAIYATEPFSRAARREAVAASQLPYTVLPIAGSPVSVRVARSTVVSPPSLAT